MTRDEDLLMVYLAFKSFDQARTGMNTVNREYEYIRATMLNRIGFVEQVSQSLDSKIGKKKTQTHNMNYC